MRLTRREAQPTISKVAFEPAMVAGLAGAGLGDASGICPWAGAPGGAVAIGILFGAGVPELPTIYGAAVGPAATIIALFERIGVAACSLGAGQLVVRTSTAGEQTARHMIRWQRN